MVAEWPTANTCIVTLLRVGTDTDSFDVLNETEEEVVETKEKETTYKCHLQLKSISHTPHNISYEYV